MWLKQWSEANASTGSNEHVGKFLGIYFAFGIGAAALVVVQTLILWIFCSIEVGFDAALLTGSLTPAVPSRHAQLLTFRPCCRHPGSCTKGWHLQFSDPR